MSIVAIDAQTLGEGWLRTARAILDDGADRDLEIGCSRVARAALSAAQRSRRATAAARRDQSSEGEAARALAVGRPRPYVRD